eukprot:5733644-Alexandrium_andersonii.AAC.1
MRQTIPVITPGDKDKWLNIRYRGAFLRNIESIGDQCLSRAFPHGKDGNKRTHDRLPTSIGQGNAAQDGRR